MGEPPEPARSGAAPSVDRRHLTRLLRQFVATDSVNPSLVPGAAGEARIAGLIADACRDAGLQARVEEVAPGRVNVIAGLIGRRPGPRLLLNGHMDTVDVAAMRDPFAARIDGDRLHGRGAYDMKGSLAAMVEAARVVAAAGLPAGELVLTFVADEEYESLGTADIVRRLRAGPLPDAAVVTEPTGLDICVAHKGFLWARIETAGRAAHGSRFGEGDDAIARMGHVLAALDRLDRQILPRRAHPLLGRASIHASAIRGGLGLSTYPDRCTLEVERRTLPGERDEEIMAELAGLLDEARRDSPGLTGRVEMLLSRPPFEVDPAALIVASLIASAHTVLGRAPHIIGDSPWFDAALFGQAGIPTVMFGPSGAGAHAAEEWVDLSSVAECARVLVDLILRFCSA